MNLTISEEFSIVKEWLLKRASQGKFLGKRPKLKVGKDLKVRGWFISLFRFKEEFPYSNLKITAGDQLIPLIGEELYLKLKVVKKSFNKTN